MAYSSRSSDTPCDNAHEDEHAQEQRPPVERVAERELVQSDELSSTSGARMVSAENPYDPQKNPHLSTSTPRIDAEQTAPEEAETPSQAAAESDVESANIHDVKPEHNAPAATDLPLQTDGATPQIPRTTQRYTVDFPKRNITRETITYVPTWRKKKKPQRTFFSRQTAIALLVIAVAIGGAFGVKYFLFDAPVQATVNGETMTLEGNARTVNGLLKEGIVNVSPGNFLAVDESVLREGEGTPCTVEINEQEVDSANAHINEGDQVVISDGTDIMEDFTESGPMPAPAPAKRVGDGALHVYFPGEAGEMMLRTGKESGISTERIIEEPIDGEVRYYNPDTNGEKVIALTFDDGPWDTSTDQILDVLKEFDAKATFFTIGDQVEEHSAQIERMVNEGHEISTHSWDHAQGSGKGVSLNLMSTEERKDEVEKGLEIVEKVSGEAASLYFRAPGGNFDDSTATDLQSIVKGEIGWNIDTEDWSRPGVGVIVEHLKHVEPGYVVLMHDGGGDRSQTVAALREALAYLSEQGYEFITISEMIERYPYQENAGS